MLNQVLNSLTKAHVNSPFKVHSCKINMMYSRCCIQIHTLLLTFIMFTMACSMFCHLQKQPYLMHTGENPQETFGGGQVPKFWFGSCPWARICVPMTTCCYVSSTSWQGDNHVLVSDKVSNITSLSYISHSRVKDSRRGVSSIILSWLDSGVSKDVMLVSSNLGVARRSPGSDVFSIFISAGVFKLPRTLSLMSVP